MSKCPLVARVQELLTIDPAEGVLRWKVNRRANKVAGSVAGSNKNDHSNRPDISPHWVINVSIDGRQYGAHNLAWVLYYGECPSKLVDHLDNNGLNNRKVNLRLATYSQNAQNRKRSITNKLGIKGLVLVPTGCWNHGAIKARIKLTGKLVQRTFCLTKLSRQAAIEKATEWRKAKVLELHQDFGNHGEQSVVIDREAGTWAVS